MGAGLVPVTSTRASRWDRSPPGITPTLPSRDVYARIALGQITSWNHPDIARINPELRLPALDITWVRRADGSGTTYVFTKHLDAIHTAVLSYHVPGITGPLK